MRIAGDTETVEPHKTYPRRPLGGNQRFRRWFTKWPSTHAQHPHTVEVVPAQDLDDLRHAVSAHRQERYGDRRDGLYSIDRRLYEAAGLGEAQAGT